MTGELLVLAMPFLAAAITTIAVTPLVRRVALRRGIVARPKNDRWHRQAIPMLGGVALWMGTVVAAGFLARSTAAAVLLLAVGTPIFVLGLVDDLVALKPGTKLLVQILIGCAAVGAGLQLDWTGSPAADAVISVLWFVGITNAFNLLDNMDGLCAGIAAIAALAFSVSAQAGGEATLLVLPAALAGAAAGFLLYNFNPASIFMGDSGSLFLGGMLAAIALAGERPGQTGVLSALAVPVLIMLIPIFDTTFVTVSRKLSGRAASLGGRDHTSHRLVALGFSERQAVLLLCSLATAGGMIAIVVGRAGFGEAGVVLALLLIALVLLGIQLARVGVYDGADFTLLKDRSYTPLLVDVTYRRRIFEILLDLCLIAIAYYAAYIIRFDRNFASYYTVFADSLPIVIACQLASFMAAGVYRGLWRYISLSDLSVFVKGVAMGTLGSIIVVLYLYRFEDYSRGVFLIYAMLISLLTLGSRLSFRAVAELAGRHRHRGERALIYGAGEAGVLLLRELRSNRDYDLQPLGFVDDDPGKTGKRVSGVPVLGTCEELQALIAEHHLDVVIISSQKIGRARREDVQKVCWDSGTRLLELDLRLRPIGPPSSVHQR